MIGVTTGRRPAVRAHQLTIEELRPVSADGSAVEVSLHVPDELRPAFAFRPGQHVRVCRAGDEPGTPDDWRSYSLCSTPAELAGRGRLRLAVRLLTDGQFSTYLHTRLAPGDKLTVRPPEGRFTTSPDPGRQRHYTALVAGSGITPVLSLLGTVLAVEPDSTFTVAYGNRAAASAMFTDELADLKDRYPDRMQVVHLLSRETQTVGAAGGRLDQITIAHLLDRGVLRPDIDEWFLCGPFGLVAAARDTLIGRGVAAEAIRVELFHPEQESTEQRRTERGSAEQESAGRPGGPAVAGPDPADGCRITLLLDGRASTVTLAAGQRVLDAALSVRPELPFSCRSGVCATCRARVVDGAVRMDRNWALDPAEVAAGFVLTCQATPATDELTVDFDA